MTAPNAAPAQAARKKPLVSRPVGYTVLAGCVVGTYLYLTMPDTSGTTIKKHTKTTTPATVSADADGITAADYNAHFPRYQGGTRNPYVPGILTASQQTASEAGATGGLGGKSGGSWALTGVSVINGVASALVENNSGDSATLQRGDQWHGLKVIGVTGNAVKFVNDAGQSSQLSFGSGAPASGANAPAVPNLSEIRPLPSITVNNNGGSQTAAPSASGGANSLGAVYRNRGGTSAAQTGIPLGDSGGPPDAGGPGGPPPPD